MSSLPPPASSLQSPLLGAIAGDIIGSVYERRPIKTTSFPLFQPRSRFTDDSVLALATAHALLTGTGYADAYREFGRRYPNAGYGGSFYAWLMSGDDRPYGSWGNGAAMRVAPIGHAFDSQAEVLHAARQSAEVTHNHPEGIKGAQAVALAVYLARTRQGKDAIRSAIERSFGYNLQRSVEQVRPGYHFDVSCQGTVPEALLAFLDSRDFEHAVRLAVSLGGDSDTLACIAGAVAHAHYGRLPEDIAEATRARLPPHLLAVADRFQAAFGQAG
jgi:ADP-ribosylglycohydrolase